MDTNNTKLFKNFQIQYNIFFWFMAVSWNTEINLDLSSYWLPKKLRADIKKYASFWEKIQTKTDLLLRKIKQICF